MKIVLLSASRIGSKTRTAIDYTKAEFKNKYPDHELILIDLADMNMQFSDGRDYREYEGDTLYVAKTIMTADALVIGTPIFQASIPGSLKNVFDLLPVNAFRDKIVAVLVTAGSPKHFLIAEQQLKPILSYMKAKIVETYVFIEEKDFYRQEIINDDIIFRIQRMVEDTVLLTDTYAGIRQAQEDAYWF